LTTITARIIADSVAANTGIRLLTFELRYPRFIHSEFMTHRVFSRNASSSRAIPVKRLIATILEDMAMPVHWGKNQPGMQAREELAGWRLWAAKTIWRTAGHSAVFFARLMDRVGGHKQIVNRITEPFSHITVVVTSTEWSNFFLLRDHPDADPTIQVLAQHMVKAMHGSTPKVLHEGQWHLPYANEFYNDEGPMARQVSAARCARTSYLTHDRRMPKPHEDVALFEKLAIAQPPHLSPVEHQATPSGDAEFHANFRGWVQFRKEIEA
jgi:hypothetical protein